VDNKVEGPPKGETLAGSAVLVQTSELSFLKRQAEDLAQNFFGDDAGRSKEWSSRSGGQGVMRDSVTTRIRGVAGGEAEDAD